MSRVPPALTALGIASDQVPTAPAAVTPASDRVPTAPAPARIAAALFALAALGIAAALLAAGALGAHRPAGARSVAIAPPLGGVNVPGLESGTTPAEIERELARAQALDAHAVRVEIPWALLEPSRQGQLDPHALALADRFVTGAARRGLRTILLAERTPCWDSSAPSSLLRRCSPDHEGRASAWPPRDPGAYASFTAFLAKRYGSKLAAIEVWNEPDQANEDYFAGPDKPRRYAAVLRAAYTAIKHADPSTTVLGASIVGSNGAFLKALYVAGIRGYYDGLSVHFYNLVLASLRSIHEVQLSHGDHTPVWLNEFGWSSCWPRWHIQKEQGCVTAAVQARNLSDTFRLLARTPWVRGQIVYELQGPPSEDFGAFSAGGKRKPAFYALRSVLISPFGRPSRVTLRLRRAGGRLIASGSGPVGDYMHLEVLRGHQPLYRAQFVMNRFNRYSIALPKVLGTRNLRASVFQYWMGTARAAAAHT